MGIFKKKTEQTEYGYAEFWAWFSANEKAFHKTIKEGKKIEKDFFNKLSPELAKIKDGLYFLAGMCGEDTAELIITPDGIVKNVVFAEELVASAPQLPGWMFTALKPSTPKGFAICMGGYDFNNDNLFFYPDNDPQYPDEVNIVVVYKDFNEKDQGGITNGVLIFLDNNIGERAMIEYIDNIDVKGPDNAPQQLMPIGELAGWLMERKKSFAYRGAGVGHDGGNDRYGSFEAELENGMPLIAVMNTTLLESDNKAAYPWLMNVQINYDGQDNNGMPDKKTYKDLDSIEDSITSRLKDIDGYLYIGRQTAENQREIYFACRDFRLPSKVMISTVAAYEGRREITFEIYKDKYWRTHRRFMK